MNGGKVDDKLEDLVRTWLIVDKAERLIELWELEHPRIMDGFFRQDYIIIKNQNIN